MFHVFAISVYKIGLPFARTLARKQRCGLLIAFPNEHPDLDHQSVCLFSQIRLYFIIRTRVCSGWGTIANPHAKVFDPPATPSPIWQQHENSLQYVFYLLFVRTHTNFGIKIFEIDMLIFDLLTLTQGP